MGHFKCCFIFSKRFEHDNRIRHLKIVPGLNLCTRNLHSDRRIFILTRLSHGFSAVGISNFDPSLRRNSVKHVQHVRGVSLCEHKHEGQNPHLPTATRYRLERVSQSHRRFLFAHNKFEVSCGGKRKQYSRTVKQARTFRRVVVVMLYYSFIIINITPWLADIHTHKMEAKDCIEIEMPARADNGLEICSNSSKNIIDATSSVWHQHKC